MLAVETPFIEIGQSLIVSFSGAAADHRPEQAQLGLLTIDTGQLLQTVQGKPGDRENLVEFPDVRLEPGMYTAQVTIAGRSLSSCVVVGDAEYKQKIVDFAELVAEVESAVDLPLDRRREAFSKVAGQARKLGVSLADFAPEVAKSLDPFDPAVPYIGAKIKIKYVRSMISCPQSHKNIVLSLGLRTLNRTVEKPDTPGFRGMVAKVPHLLQIVD